MKKSLIDNSKHLIAIFIGAIIGIVIIGYTSNIVFDGKITNIITGQIAAGGQFSISDISNRVTALESAIATSGTKTTSAENSITNYGTRIATLEARGGVAYWTPDDVNVPTATNTVLFSFTVPTTGKSYTISASAVFAANATGYRRVFLASDSTCSTWLGYAWSTAVNASNTWKTAIGFSATRGAGAGGQTYYLCATQNSGTTLATSGRIYISVN